MLHHVNLYLTADRIVESGHGGGTVTYNESEALKTLGNCDVWDRDKFDMCWKDHIKDPWDWDKFACSMITVPTSTFTRKSDLCHIYSGTFSDSVKILKTQGSKVTYTCAAHRVEDSKKAHEELGYPYPYPHLTDPELWKKYSQGYRDADILIVPSKHSEMVVREQGCTNRIEVIPHGCNLPKNTNPIPKQFVVGTIGAICGPDKGLVYLLQAWKKLNYKDALLILAGSDSTSDYVRQLINIYGGGSIQLRGRVENLSDFFDNISVYCQSSCTEGFGIPVLEAHAHGRVSICSDHAGAVDLVHESCKFPANNVDALASKIDEIRKTHWDLAARGSIVREQSYNYTWGKIRNRYTNLWRELLGILNEI